MKRVAIVGGGGSGKSRMAVLLGEATGIPVVHLDMQFWGPGWTPPPNAEWHAAVGRLIAEERWIMDGNFDGTMEERLDAADTIIFMDFHPLERLRGAIGRIIRNYGRARPDMAEGCLERLDLKFLWWVYQFPQRAEVVRRIVRRRSGRRIAVLKSRAAMDRFLASIREEADASC